MPAPKAVIAAVVAMTLLLAIPAVTMAPTESASTEPGGDVFTARDRIDELFVSSVHPTFLVAVADDGDMLRPETLRALWDEAGLPAAELAKAADPALRAELEGEHREAVERGITGVPAVCVEGDDAFILGAQPLAVYRRWVERRLAG